MKYEWKEDWADFDDLIDSQIIRKNGTLRMVGSCKLGKNSYLELDNPAKYSFEDSLIRIYDHELFNLEKKVKWTNHDMELINSKIPDAKQKTTIINYKYKDDIKWDNSKQYDIEIFKEAFKLINDIQPGIFNPGKINGAFMTLSRIKSAPCFFSQKVHDNIDGFIKIRYDEEKKIYDVILGCYRKNQCSERYTTVLGYVFKTQYGYHGFHDNKKIHVHNNNNTLNISK